MAAITAKMVNELRTKTGAGMMDCKKALVETEGNFDEAIKVLREKGLSKADKKAGRIAAEGVVDILSEGCTTAMIEVNAETDFVAKNDLFVEFVKGVSEVVAKENPADLEALMSAKYPGGDLTVEQVQQDKVLVIGENIKVRRFARYAEGVNVPYVHMGGRIGVLVNMESTAAADNEKLIELGKDVAMQIAALNPQFLDKSDISEEFIENEKKIRLAQAKEDPKNANKPDNIIEKIITGGLNKYYKEICLMQQPFVKDDKVSVEQHVAAVAKEIGADITVKAYTRFEKGEGIEKKEENFAEEIASMIK